MTPNLKEIIDSIYQSKESFFTEVQRYKSFNYEYPKFNMDKYISFYESKITNFRKDKVVWAWSWDSVDKHCFNSGIRIFHVQVGKKKQNEIICVLSFFHSIFFNNLCSSRRISTTKLAKYSVGVVRWCWNYTCGNNFFLADISLFFIVSPIFLFGDIKQTVYGVIAHTTFVIIQLQALKVLY